MQTPAGLPAFQIVNSGSAVEILCRLIGKPPGLIGVQKPVGTNSFLEQEPFPVDPDEPGGALFVRLLDGNPVRIGGGNCHGNFGYFQARKHTQKG